MDQAMIKQQAVKFNRARNNLLAVVVLTAVNLLLLTMDINFHFFFSAFAPQVLLVVLEEFFGPAFGLIAALACTALYFVGYLLSKRYRVFMLVALILFGIDALIMLGGLFMTGAVSEFIFNIAFHGWILFYLITGTIAWAHLRRVTPDHLQTIQQEVSHTTQTQELNAALNTIAPPHQTNGIAQPRLEAQPEVDNGMYVVDDFIKNRILASYHRIENLYLFEEIPLQKLENAKRSYAPALGADETIIFLYDDTIKGSANEGFILTGKRLYSKNFGIKSQAVPVSSMNSMTVPKFGRISSNIHVHLNTGNTMEIHITRKATQAEAIFNMLDRTVALLRNQARRV